MSRPNKARLIRARRSTAVAIYKGYGVQGLTPDQLNLLVRISKVERSHYGIDDWEWLEIEAHALNESGSSPVV